MSNLHFVELNGNVYGGNVFWSEATSFPAPTHTDLGSLDREIDKYAQPDPITQIHKPCKQEFQTSYCKKDKENIDSKIFYTKYTSALQCNL